MKRLLPLLAFIVMSLQLMAQVDFRKETIYFLITSRFFDGDSTNNAPTEWCSYIPGVNNPQMTDPHDLTWRGDFKGLIEKLDYIKGMGFTAIWITPILENRSPLDYHGYHTWDFTTVDHRLESPGAKFQDLVNAVHAKGMKLVLDIVTNHSCRYGIKGMSELKYNTDTTQVWGKNTQGAALGPNPNWQYDGLTPNPDDGKIWSRANLATMPSPYNQNLANYNWPCTEAFVNTSDSNWFHHSGNGFVQGWDDTLNCYERAIADDCPDLNTGSKAVQDYMFGAYKKFIDMGVDAFRWDTWKDMNKEDIFALADRFKAENPNLFIFGEVAQKRFELHPVEQLNPHWYTWRGEVNASAPSELGVIDFYAEATFHNTFQNGEAFSGVTDAARYDYLYGDPSLLVTWLDNHDFGPNNDWNQRYGGTPENLAACMNFMFTWRGIPCVYYGTEEQFQSGLFCDIQNSSDISKSLDLTGRAYYGNEFANAQNTKLYAHFKKLNAIRRAIPALQSGSWTWAGNYPGNGIGYTRTLGSQVVAVGLAKDGDASFSFTGLTNGIYRDAVTGREVNVANGTLNFSVQSVSAGIYVLNGPGMIGGNGLGYFEACANGCTTPPSVSISPISDNYYSPITVTMGSTGGSGSVSIHYTTDGSYPTAGSPVYGSLFKVGAATIVKAIAIDASGDTSDMEGQSYTFDLPQPRDTIFPAGGNFFNPITVSITAGGAGTKPPYKIYYTMDGSTPTTASTLYKTSFLVNGATTIKAIAIDSNNQVSTVVTNSYTFIIPPPVISASPVGANYPAGNVSVSLGSSSPRPPVTIYYTTDGSTPTTASREFTTPINLNGPAQIILKYFGVDSQGRASSVDSQKYTFSPIPNIWVYFKKPTAWGSKINIYYWNALPTGAVNNVVWPGVAATRVCQNGNWWAYEFTGVTSVNVIFNDGTNQTSNLTGVDSTSYFDDNTLLKTIPNIYSPAGSLVATPTTGVAPFTVSFDASGSTGCSLLDYFWNFGDSSYLQGGLVAQASYTYNKSGVFNMNVIVQDQNNQRDTVTQTSTVRAASQGMTLHFKPATAWTNTPYFYYWSATPTAATDSWPGVPMVSEGNGWWKYFIPDSCSSLIFNNNSSPQTANLSHCGDGWYDGTTNTWVADPLPLKLLGFSGLEKGGQIVLQWSTTNETGVKGYAVERNENGSFVDVGFVKAKNANGNIEYGYTDAPTISSSKLLYRLKMINIDGTYGFSNTIELGTPTKDVFTIFPNPAKGKLYLSFGPDNNSVYTATLIDITGKIITTKQIEVTGGQGNSFQIPESLRAGTYLLKLVDMKTNAMIIKKVEIAD